VLRVDLSKMKEIVCQDCQKPLIAVPAEGGSDRYTFFGCRCQKAQYELPDVVYMAGPVGGPMSFYQPGAEGRLADLGHS
jgi:hypothetical protein